MDRNNDSSMVDIFDQQTRAYDEEVGDELMNQALSAQGNGFASPIVGLPGTQFNIDLRLLDTPAQTFAPTEAQANDHLTIDPRLLTLPGPGALFTVTQPHPQSNIDPFGFGLLALDPGLAADPDTIADYPELPEFDRQNVGNPDLPEVHVQNDRSLWSHLSPAGHHYWLQIPQAMLQSGVIRQGAETRTSRSLTSSAFVAMEGWPIWYRRDVGIFYPSFRNEGSGLLEIPGHYAYGPGIWYPQAPYDDLGYILRLSHIELEFLSQPILPIHPLPPVMTFAPQSSVPDAGVAPIVPQTTRARRPRTRASTRNPAAARGRASRRRGHPPPLPGTDETPGGYCNGCHQFIFDGGALAYHRSQPRVNGRCPPLP